MAGLLKCVAAVVFLALLSGEVTTIHLSCLFACLFVCVRVFVCVCLCV